MTGHVPIDTAEVDPFITRAHLCQGDFHVWISAGPHHPRLPCNCGRVERRNREAANLKRQGPPIYVNGVEVRDEAADE
jgi:hypothetical protein